MTAKKPLISSFSFFTHSLAPIIVLLIVHCYFHQFHGKIDIQIEYSEQILFTNVRKLG